jgi:hypothetical protein
LGASRARATTLPENWYPKAFDPVVDQATFEAMKDYCLAHRRTYVDWEAAARQWKRNQSKYDRTASTGAPRGKRAGSIIDAIDNFIDQNGGIEAANRYVPGSSGPGSLNLDSQSSAHGVRRLPSR